MWWHRYFENAKSAILSENLQSVKTHCVNNSKQFKLQPKKKKRGKHYVFRDNVTFSKVFKALSMHEVVDRISYCRFLPKSAEKSVWSFWPRQKSIFQLTTHIVTNTPPVLTNPPSSHHIDKPLKIPHRRQSARSSWVYFLPVDVEIHRDGGRG